MICSMIITILPSNFVIFLVFCLVVMFYNAVEIIKYLMHIKSTEIVIILFPDGLIETSRSFLQDVHFLSLMIDRLYFYFHVYWDVSIVMCFSDEEYVNKKLCTINQLLGCVFVSLKWYASVHLNENFKSLLF